VGSFQFLKPIEEKTHETICIFSQFSVDMGWVHERFGEQCIPIQNGNFSRPNRTSIRPSSDEITTINLFISEVLPAQILSPVYFIKNQRNELTASS